MKCEGGWWDQIFRALVVSGYDLELSLLSSELFLTNPSASKTWRPGFSAWKQFPPLWRHPRGHFRPAPGFSFLKLHKWPKWNQSQETFAVPKLEKSVMSHMWHGISARCVGPDQGLGPVSWEVSDRGSDGSVMGGQGGGLGAWMGHGNRAVLPNSIWSISYWINDSNSL